jgi:hypothetical protein
VIARTLSRRIELLTSDVRVFQALQYLQCDPEIVGRTVEQLTISVEPYRGYYRIFEDGELLWEEMTPRAVMEALHARLFALSLEDYPTSPLLHAASLRRGGRRFLLVGNKGTGKTTLTLRLIQEGYEIEGDENVFVTSEGVIARPRGLRVKDSVVKVMPGIAQILGSTPSYTDKLGQRVYNLDPRLAGATSWRIEPGEVEAVVVLRPNHGGYSSLRPLPLLALVREVILETGLHETERGKAISALTRAIGSSKGFDLSLGDHAGALASISRLFQ